MDSDLLVSEFEKIARDDVAESFDDLDLGYAGKYITTVNRPPSHLKVTQTTNKSLRFVSDTKKFWHSYAREVLSGRSGRNRGRSIRRSSSLDIF